MPIGTLRAVLPGVRLLAAPLCAMALAGCAAILPQSPSAIFDLSAPGDVAAPRGDLQILVPEPSALKALDTERIAARPAPSQYAYLPDALWSDRLPKLLQVRFIETLQNSGRVRAAGLPGQGLLIDFQIVMDVRAFELADAGATVEFAVKLMDESNGRVIRSRVIRQVVPVASTENAVVVAALDAAMDAAYLEITRWAFAR